MALASGLTASITLTVDSGDTALAHLSPTPVGSEVTAEATLEGVEGRRLTFRVSVTDARGLVAAGRITRVVVVRDRFVERAQSEL